MNINRRFLKMTSNYTSKPLNNELALEKGIEIFYEIMIYAILIGFSVFEMVVSTKEANQKKKVHPHIISAVGRATGLLQSVTSSHGGKCSEGQP